MLLASAAPGVACRNQPRWKGQGGTLQHTDEHIPSAPLRAFGSSNLPMSMANGRERRLQAGHAGRVLTGKTACG